MTETSRKIAKDLLKIQAVFLSPDEPFTWASGIKSPVYCDNRLTLTAPEVRTDVETGLKELIEENYPEAEVLMGTSTAGIAHAAIAAHLLGLPMGYVRSGSKDHGRKNQIEGRLEAGQRVVVIEDLISTGGSVLDTVAALREAGARRCEHLHLRHEKGRRAHGRGEGQEREPDKSGYHRPRGRRGALHHRGGCRAAAGLPRRPRRRKLDHKRRNKLI